MRGRAGQALAAHHTRLHISHVHDHVRRRIRKSAILRAKRLGDEGRKSKPVIKVEHNSIHWIQSLTGTNIETGSASDRDDGMNEVEHAAATSVGHPSTQNGEVVPMAVTSIATDPSQVGTSKAARTPRSTAQNNKKEAVKVNKILNKARKKAGKK